MSTKPISAIAFDLDGTLIDSAAGVAFALNAALAVAGLPPFELPTVRGWIGDGPDALIQRALEASRLRDTDLGVLAAKLRNVFDSVTLNDPAAQGEAYDGMAELLEDLSAGFPLVVVTNKPTPLARAVLKSAGLLGHFSAVHGADTHPQRKPSPLLIQQAAQGLGVQAETLLMVGDGPADLQSARAAGCRAAWVSWGYGHPPGMPSADVWRIDAPAELLDWLQSPENATRRAPIH